MRIPLPMWQMNQREAEVKNKVCSVALTDSAHNIWLQETTKSTQEWMLQVKNRANVPLFLSLLSSLPFVFVARLTRTHKDSQPQPSTV